MEKIIKTIIFKEQCLQQHSPFFLRQPSPSGNATIQLTSLTDVAHFVTFAATAEDARAIVLFRLKEKEIPGIANLAGPFTTFANGLLSAPCQHEVTLRQLIEAVEKADFVKVPEQVLYIASLSG